MSTKATIAYGDNWHLYEELMNEGGLWLRIDNTSVFIKKEALKSILAGLKSLEERNWQLTMDDEPEIVKGQISWLDSLQVTRDAKLANEFPVKTEMERRTKFKKWIYGDDWVPENDHREGCNDGPHCSICGWCEFDGQCVCYSR